MSEASLVANASGQHGHEGAGWRHVFSGASAPGRPFDDGQKDILERSRLQATCGVSGCLEFLDAIDGTVVAAMWSAHVLHVAVPGYDASEKGKDMLLVQEWTALTLVPSSFRVACNFTSSILCAHTHTHTHRRRLIVFRGFWL